MKYHVVRSSDLVDLVEMVNNYLAGGWEPVGGVSVSEAAYPRYAQAIIKRSYDDD